MPGSITSLDKLDYDLEEPKKVKKSDQLLFYFIDSPRSIRSTRLYYKKGGYTTKAMQAFLSWLPSHL